MADTLLDMLRKKREGTASAPGAAFAPPGGSTEDLARHVAEGSGRGTTQGSVVSSIPEQVANADTSDALMGLRDQDTAQQAQENVAAAGIQDASTRLNRETTEKAASISSAAKRQADSLLADYETGRKQLGSDQDKAGAEQLAFTVRLGNDKYINDLMNASNREMINSDADFARAFQEQEFADSMSLFGNAQAFRQVMAMDQAQFAKEIANRDMSDILAGYKRMDQTRKDQAPYAVLGAGMSGGAQAWSASQQAGAAKSSRGDQLAKSAAAGNEAAGDKYIEEDHTDITGASG